MPDIIIEVAYATAAQQVVLSLPVAIGSSVREAIQQSGLLAQYPEINLDINPLGIFGKRVTLEQALMSGDRIEIYRPLSINPMERRRLVAKKTLTKKSPRRRRRRLRPSAEALLLQS